MNFFISTSYAPKSTQTRYYLAYVGAERCGLLQQQLAVSAACFLVLENGP